MNAIYLPDLLEALGETFLVPGAFPFPTFEVCQDAPWVDEDLSQAIDALLSADHWDLSVAYAELFLVGRRAPTLHLEASSLHHGRLGIPEVEADLAAIYRTADLSPHPHLQVAPDHLGLQTAALAALLRQLAGIETAEADPRRLAAQRLIEGHLAPSADLLRERLPKDASPFYRAAINLLQVSLRFTRRLLA